MIAYCNYIPDAIWVRDVVNGVRRVTLRRNFVEEASHNQDDISEVQYKFEQIDVFIVDRPSLEDYVLANFDELFMSRLEEYKQNKES